MSLENLRKGNRWSGVTRRTRALGLGASVMALSAASALGCLAVYDFDGYEVSSASASGGGGGGGAGGAGGAMASTASSSASSSASTGGGGGSSGCMDADLMGDSLNCGACGVSCAGGGCKAGICKPFSIDLGIPALQVAVLNNLVFVLQGDSNLVTFPDSFIATDDQGLMVPVCDTVGFLSRAGDRVYFRPQNATSACGNDEYLYTCAFKGGCTMSTHILSVHMNGVAVAKNGILYYALPSPAEIHGAPFELSGIPSTMEVSPVPVPSMDMPADGAFHLAYEPTQDALWWTTLHGCVYKAQVADLPLANPAPCSPQTVPSPEQLIVAPDGKIYVASTDQSIYEIDPSSAGSGQAKVFAPPPLSLLSADADYVYAFDSTAPAGIVALRRSDGSVRARVPTVAPVTFLGADASSLTYLFYVTGTELFRWRKPPTP